MAWSRAWRSSALERSLRLSRLGHQPGHRRQITSEDPLHQCEVKLTVPIGITPLISTHAILFIGGLILRLNSLITYRSAVFRGRLA